MYDLSSADFWVIASMGLAVGLFAGWLMTTLFQRRRAGGKNAQQLRNEMAQYRDEVNEHFARTAELFKESTEKYRDLYEHLAGGAQTLANDLPDRTQVDFRPGKLLANQSNDDSVVSSTHSPASDDQTAQVV
ncbi:MAG: YhcB family protein [Gammaproteobacteria bacterium]|nr:YhcB family protein [Gammaproteobacteria bacterium]MDH3766862.1 YhcB family protein [Gammaproteobacteria bacterium]